jgi:hypothetical protein
MRRSLSVASTTSASGATINSNTSSIALLAQASPNGIQTVKSRNAPLFHSHQLSSTDRSRVLKSTIKLRQMLGEPLSEEVVKQFVVLPKRKARFMDPKQFPHWVEFEPSSTSRSRVSTENHAFSDTTLPQSGRRTGRPSLPATSKETTLRRAAKLYCILGERVHINSPYTPPPLVPSNEPSSTRVRKLTDSPEHGYAKAPITKNNRGIETVERFAREGLINQRKFS